MRIENFGMLPCWLLDKDDNSNGTPDIIDFPDPNLPENVVYFFYEEAGGPSITTVNDL